MRKLFILLLSVLSLTVFAQQKKVAVYVMGQETGINKVLGDQLVSAFTRSGKYIAVERTSSFLAELGKEQSYQRTGAVSDNEISRLGKQFGVQLVCVAEISEVFGQKYVSARLIDVETAELINTSNASSSLNSMNDLLNVSNSIATGLAGKTGKEIGIEQQENEAKMAEQQREENNKRQQEQQLRQQEYNRLKKAMSDGYVQMDRLLVSIPDFSEVSYYSAKRTARNCRLGGYSGWRLPTQGELGRIFRTSAEYHNQCPSFPYFLDEKYYRSIEDGSIRATGLRYWCSGSYYYTQYYRYESLRQFYSNAFWNEHVCYVILVKDK